MSISMRGPRVCKKVGITPELANKFKRKNIVLEASVIGADLLDMLDEAMTAFKNSGMDGVTLTYGHYFNFLSVEFRKEGGYASRLNRHALYQLEDEFLYFIMESALKATKL